MSSEKNSSACMVIAKAWHTTSKQPTPSSDQRLTRLIRWGVSTTTSNAWFNPNLNSTTIQNHQKRLHHMLNNFSLKIESWRQKVCTSRSKLMSWGSNPINKKKPSTEKSRTWKSKLKKRSGNTCGSKTKRKTTTSEKSRTWSGGLSHSRRISIMPNKKSPIETAR